MDVERARMGKGTNDCFFGNGLGILAVDIYQSINKMYGMDEKGTTFFGRGF